MDARGGILGGRELTNERQVSSFPRSKQISRSGEQVADLTRGGFRFRRGGVRREMKNQNPIVNEQHTAIDKTFSVLPPNYRLKLTAPSFTPLASVDRGGQASCPRPAA